MFKTTTWLGGEGGKTNKFAVSASQKQILIFGRVLFIQRIQLPTCFGKLQICNHFPNIFLQEAAVWHGHHI